VDSVEGLLSYHKVADDRVTHHTVAHFTELAGIAFGNLYALLLLLMELLATLGDFDIQPFGGFIGEEALDLGCVLGELGLVEEGLAELDCLLLDSVFFGGSYHLLTYASQRTSATVRLLASPRDRGDCFRCMGSPLRIGFVSTRFHGTDGVTLEAKKWARVLEEKGHRCFWFAGKLDTPEASSYLCDKAFFDHPEILELQSRLFDRKERGRETSDQIHALREEMKDALYKFCAKFDLDLLIPQNILAIPMHVPLGLAMTEFLAETRTPAIAHHHDFVWERERFVHSCVPDYLRMAFPPQFGGKFRSVVINSKGQADLARRAGLPSTVVPNVFDYENPPPAPDGYADDFRAQLGISKDETLVLQPTRVVPRKGIEHAIELVRELQKRGRKICLLVSHEAGDEGMDYYHLLKARADEAGIRCHFAGDRIGEIRGEDADGNKVYTLWDAYPHADFVTYPSLYEGFGNAFLETLYFCKPMLVNRYSVYTRDIQPLGFEVVEMDGVVTKNIADQVEAVLDDPEGEATMVRHNYELAGRYFSHQVLHRTLGQLVGELFGEDS